MDPSNGLVGYLFTQGVLGFACFVLGWVCIKLYNKTERLQSEKDVLQKEKEAIIEARRLESVQTVTDYKDIVQGNSQSNALLIAKIEAVKTEGGK